MPLHQGILRFNAGELTPYLAHSIDFEKHPAGATTLENFLPLPFGGIRKRPGTVHLASQTDDALLETVRFTDGVSYVLAFSASSLRIYEQDGTLDDTVTADFGDPFLL